MIFFQRILTKRGIYYAVFGPRLLLKHLSTPRLDSVTDNMPHLG